MARKPLAHSPAPFRCDTKLGCRKIFDADGDEVCFTAGLADDNMDRQNARVLTAAPEMLELLLEAQQVLSVLAPQSHAGLIGRMARVHLRATKGHLHPSQRRR